MSLLEHSEWCCFRRKGRLAIVAALSWMCLCTTFVGRAGVPADYQGKPFADAVHKAGPPNIPGIVQAALYDLGGEGVAYHDTDATNNGSGKLNLEPGHQKPHASAYIWHFRKDEGVDISFVKDGADLNHTNLVSPHLNQLYVGWTENGEWCNYTVNVTRCGTYRIKALYAYQTNIVTFDLNGKAAATCRLPVLTSSYHHWTIANIGSIHFPEAGPQLLSFHYGKGNNFAYFEFELVESPPTRAAEVPNPRNGLTLTVSDRALTEVRGWGLMPAPFDREPPALNVTMLETRTTTTQMR
jgi:hypothetical protein